MKTPDRRRSKRLALVWLIVATIAIGGCSRGHGVGAPAIDQSPSPSLGTVAATVAPLPTTATTITGTPSTADDGDDDDTPTTLLDPTGNPPLFPAAVDQAPSDNDGD